MIKIDGPSYGPVSLTVGTTPVSAVTGLLPSGVRRKGIYIQPISNNIYWGHTASVAASTGIEIGKGNVLFLPMGEAVDVYLVSNSGTVDVRVSEEG